MKNKDLKDKYDTIFKNGAFSFFNTNGFDEALKIASLCDWKDKKVLDIGCGEGRLPCMIASAEASQVVGVDYSEEAIRNAADRFNLPNLQFAADDYRAIEGEFDVVTMQGVIEHLDKPWD